jgi:predicted MPP superfamily phosphohydrolase
MGREPDPTRRRVLRAATAVVVGTFTGLTADAVVHEQSALDTTRQLIDLDPWPRALDGLTIGFLTDFHRSSTVPRALIDRAVDTVLSLRPDLIVLGGDYVSFGERQYVGSVAESIARLRAPGGVFAVLGNHDDERHVPAALTRAGAEVLKDARTRITVSGQALDLVGVKYWTRRLEDIAPLVDRSQPARILLAHDPRRLREAAELGFPLVLSGHTHGGQVVLPGLGAIAARKFPVASGLAARERTRLFVSRGIGTVYLPVRYHCPPEVALVTLRSAAPASPAAATT